MSFLDKIWKRVPANPSRESITKDLPAYLKDPKNYFKIQRALLDTLKGKHSHSEVQSMANCTECTRKYLELREMKKKLGFKNPAQYFAWKKIMEIMIFDRKDPIPK